MTTPSRLPLRRLALATVLLAAGLVLAPAQAQWRPIHPYHGGPTVIVNGGWGWWDPWPLWYAGYYGYGPYFVGPPYYAERATPITPAEAGLDRIPPPPVNWYYCEPTRTYYPYVQTCSTAWKVVPATPPADSAPAAAPVPAPAAR